MCVARHVGPVKKSRRLPVTFLGEASLLVEFIFYSAARPESAPYHATMSVLVERWGLVYFTQDVEYFFVFAFVSFGVRGPQFQCERNGLP